MWFTRRQPTNDALVTHDALLRQLYRELRRTWLPTNAARCPTRGSDLRSLQRAVDATLSRYATALDAKGYLHATALHDKSPDVT